VIAKRKGRAVRGGLKEAWSKGARQCSGELANGSEAPIHQGH
jgi:hypothetical protein